MYTFFTNVLSSQRLDNLAYVVSIGIDEGEIEKYKLTFQISTVKSSSSSSEGGSEGSSSSDSSGMPSYVTHTVECNSIDMGISLMNTYINKQLNLSHCKVIVLSEAVAKKGIRSIVYNFVNKIEMLPDCSIMVCSIPEKEFDGKDVPAMGKILPKFFDLTTNTEEEETEYSQNISINDFYVALENPLAEPYCGIGIVHNTKSKSPLNDKNTIGIDKTSSSIASQEEELMVDLLGLAAFKDDVMVGELSGIETLCHFILTDHLDQGIVTIPSPFDSKDNLNIYISMTRNPKIHVYLDDGGTPFIKVDANLIGRLLSFNNTDGTLNEDVIKQIEDAAEKYLTKQLYDYLYKTSKELKCDISSIGKYASLNFLTRQELENYHWLDNYSTANFAVQLNVGIKSGYFLTNK